MMNSKGREYKSAIKKALKVLTKIMEQPNKSILCFKVTKS